MTTQFFGRIAIASALAMTLGGCGHDKKNEGSNDFLKALEQNQQAAEADAVGLTESGVEVKVDESAAKDGLTTAVMQLIALDDCHEPKLEIIFHDKHGKHHGNPHHEHAHVIMVRGKEFTGKQMIKTFALKDKAKLSWAGIAPGRYLLIVTLLDDKGDAKESGRAKVNVKDGEATAVDLKVRPIEEEGTGSIEVNIERPAEK